MQQFRSLLYNRTEKLFVESEEKEVGVLSRQQWGKRRKSKRENAKSQFYVDSMHGKQTSIGGSRTTSKGY